MPNMSRRSIRVNDNGSTVSQINRRNLSQASRGTTESGISDTDTVDLKDTASLLHSVSICHFKLTFFRFFLDMS